MNIVPVGPEPARLACPCCGASIVTRTENKSSTKTHLIALVLLFVFFPCVCVPYCTSCCRDTNHYCPNCNEYLGTYAR